MANWSTQSHSQVQFDWSWLSIRGVPLTNCMCPPHGHLEIQHLNRNTLHCMYTHAHLTEGWATSLNQPWPYTTPITLWLSVASPIGWSLVIFQATDKDTVNSKGAHETQKDKFIMKDTGGCKYTQAHGAGIPFPPSTKQLNGFTRFAVWVSIWYHKKKYYTEPFSWDRLNLVNWSLSLEINSG